MDWLHYHAPKLDTSQGWVRFITDATMLLQQMHVGIGMVLRKMDLQSNAWHPDEFAPITQSTRRSLKWFEDNKPKDADVPPWATFLLTALEGSFRTQVRLADECHKALTKGFMVLHEVEGQTGELEEKE